MTREKAKEMIKEVSIYYLVNENNGLSYGGYDTLDDAISVAKEQTKDAFSISKVTSIEEIIYLSESENKNEQYNSNTVRTDYRGGRETCGSGHRTNKG